VQIKKADPYWIRCFIHLQARAAGIVKPLSCHRVRDCIATHCSARLRHPGAAGAAVPLAI
jgi:hypothetical protein